MLRRIVAFNARRTGVVHSERGHFVTGNVHAKAQVLHTVFGARIGIKKVCFCQFGERCAVQLEQAAVNCQVGVAVYRRRLVFAFNIRVIYPGTFSFTFLLNVMTMLFVGGRYTQWGVIISAPLLWSINVYMPDAVQKLSNYIYAALLIIVLMARPEGLITRKMVLAVKNFFKGLFKKKAGESA